MRLWKSLDEIQAFQLPQYDDDWLKDYVFECQRLMYESYFDHRNKLSPEQLIEVKFEDLVKSPQETVAQIYGQLNLEGFDGVQAPMQQYFDQRKGHKTNPMTLDDSLMAEIDNHWKPYADAFGY